MADVGDEVNSHWEDTAMINTTVRAIRPLVGHVLGSHLVHMGPKSLFNLAVALDAMRRDDIEGSLTIHVTPKGGRSLEVDWRSGQN